MKEDRYTVRIDSATSLELQELCKEYKVGMSTIIRTLLKRSLDEVRSKIDATQKEPV